MQTNSNKGLTNMYEFGGSGVVRVEPQANYKPIVARDRSRASYCPAR